MIVLSWVEGAAPGDGDDVTLAPPALVEEPVLDDAGGGVVAVTLAPPALVEELAFGGGNGCAFTRSKRYIGTSANVKINMIIIQDVFVIILIDLSLDI
jgi:hypothetical protein